MIGKQCVVGIGGQRRSRGRAHRRPLRVAAIAALLVLASALLPAAGVRAAGPFTVNTAADTHDMAPGNGACADAAGHCSLRAAIEEATALGGATTVSVPDPNTVPNSPATDHTYVLALGELKAGQSSGTNITLAGAATPATTIVKQTQPGTCPATPSTCHRVLNVDYALHGNITLSISNLTITGGSGSTGGGGGGILDGDPGDVLNLDNVVFDGNTTSAFNGGAISFTGGGVLHVQNSTFINNSSPTGNGGAIHFLQTQAGSLTITGSTFTGNVASGGVLGGQGGALNIGCNICNPFTISGSTFTNNTATRVGASGGQGGAIMLGAGTLNLNFNRITGNLAAGGGTGIYDGGGTANAANNWWGCNAGPGQAGCATAVNDGGTLTANPWIVLDVSAAPAVVDPLHTSVVTADMTQNSNGADTSGAGHVPNGTPVVFGATLGAVNPASAGLANGKATTTYTAGTTGGAGAATATVDGQTVSTAITVNQPPGVTQQPSDQTVCAGAQASFTSAASGQPAPSVQWQVSANAGATWGDVPGAVTPTLVFVAQAQDDGKRYRAVFTNSAGAAASAAAALTVNTVPEVTSQPVSRTLKAGQAVTFMAVASSRLPSDAAWQVSADGGATWDAVGGANTPVLTFTAQPADSGSLYRAVFTNGCGSTPTHPAELTVLSRWLFLPIVTR